MVLKPSRLALAALIITTAGVSLVGAPAFAIASPAAKEVCYDKTVALPSGEVVTKEVCSDASGGSNRDAKPAAAQERICTYGVEEIPCTYQDRAWNGSCYVKLSDPQPPKSEAIWEGREDGLIVDCFPYACVFQQDQDNLPRSDCEPPRQQWLPSLPGTVDPELLAREAIDTMQLQPIEIGIVPDDTPDAIGYLGAPAWFWAKEPADNTYGPITASANAGGTGVTATATVDHIEWDLGDGTTLTCDGPGTPYEDRFGVADSPDCGHRFETQGARTVTATAHWTVDWTGGGQEGTIPLELTAETQIRIGELQVLTQQGTRR